MSELLLVPAIFLSNMCYPFWYRALLSLKGASNSAVLVTSPKGRISLETSDVVQQTISKKIVRGLKAKILSQHRNFLYISFLLVEAEKVMLQRIFGRRPFLYNTNTPSITRIRRSKLSLKYFH